MAVTFNSSVNPKAKTELFKIYIQTGGTTALPTYELQGRGVTSWSVDQGGDGISKENDVLGYVDMTRGIPQPVQSGVQLYLRKDNVLSTILMEAWMTGDFSKLDSLSILQKFEYIDGETTGSVVARKQDECMITINSFNGEAGNDLNFDVDIHYSNKITMGQMTLEDASPIVFTPDEDDSE